MKDACDYDIEYTATIKNDDGSYSALPSWIVFHEPTRIFTVTPAVGDKGLYNIEIAAELVGTEDSNPT